MARRRTHDHRRPANGDDLHLMQAAVPDGSNAGINAGQIRPAVAVLAEH
jgi:hypothetical protein